MLLNLVPKMKFYTLLISLSDFLWLYYNGSVHTFNNLNCIMQLKQFYKIATKVRSRKKVLLLLVIYLTAQLVCQRAFSLLDIRFLRPWFESCIQQRKTTCPHFDSKIACLCQSIEIDNKHIYMRVRTHVRYCWNTYISAWNPNPFRFLENIISTFKKACLMHDDVKKFTSCSSS